METSGSEFYRCNILENMETATQSNFSDAKLNAQLTAITYCLMWIAEELHELNERSKDG